MPKKGAIAGSANYRRHRPDAVEISSDLTWSDNETPVSIRFDDCYFSRTNGREETTTVFIGGNMLPDAWSDSKIFTIGELGFGTGLNFAETINQWSLQGPKQAKLTYISFERYPLTLEQIERALLRWPDLLEQLIPYLQNWPPSPGYSNVSHRDITLMLYIGDARQQIQKCAMEVDCWYLDGFSPSKNPELWEADLLKQVFQRTKSGGTFSTFTSAGWVRRNLEDAGFHVRKQAGYGNKRNRLQGYKLQPIQPDLHSS